jgi:hypothetical protein
MTPMRKSSRRGGNEGPNMIRLPITLCLSIIIICLALVIILPYPLVKLSIPIGRIITNGSIA